MGVLRLVCDRYVFNPALSESSLPFAEAILGLDLRGQLVVDAGCGSGLLGISAKIAGAGRVVAFDCNQKAVENTRRNIRVSGAAGFETLLADRMPVCRRGVDMIVCNPPFFDREISERWHRSFCDPQHEFFRNVLQDAYSVLKSTGCLLMACGGDLSEDYVKKEVECHQWRTRLLRQSAGELRVRILSLRRRWTTH